MISEKTKSIFQNLCAIARNVRSIDSAEPRNASSAAFSLLGVLVGTAIGFLVIYFFGLVEAFASTSGVARIISIIALGTFNFALLRATELLLTRRTARFSYLFFEFSKIKFQGSQLSFNEFCRIVEQFSDTLTICPSFNPANENDIKWFFCMSKLTNLSVLEGLLKIGVEVNDLNFALNVSREELDARRAGVSRPWEQSARGALQWMAAKKVGGLLDENAITISDVEKCQNGDVDKLIYAAKKYSK